MQETPSANRLHIGVFGKTNSGKSTLINAIAGQEVSIVSEFAGTTTDPVTKAMEIAPLGACVIMDTAGFDDTSTLGQQRIQKTKLMADKADIALLLFSGADNEEEFFWYDYLKEKKIPVICVINKCDMKAPSEELIAAIVEKTGEKPVLTGANTGQGLVELKEALVRAIPEDYQLPFITGGLVSEDDVVLLVMPQDKQAPKGRLILPQVQTIRELLDKKCIVVSVTTDKLDKALAAMVQPPKMIITDSQVFGYVYEHKPKESMLTSFSVLFAAYKGDLPYYLEGAKAIDGLTQDSRVLIAECCTHAPLSEDIGREKIPNMLRKRAGQGLQVDIVSGTDFPEDLSAYDLVIQCGGCMFNRQYILSRIQRAKNQHVAMTNYGVTIAHVTGILDKVTF